MKINDTVDQLLKSLHLARMRQLLPSELARAQNSAPSYIHFLEGLLREEHAYRLARQQEYRLKQAAIPERWALETFPFHRQPGVNKAQILQLAELDFIKEAHNLVLMGPTGVGKTGLGSGLLLKAIENGHRGLFVKAQDLFDEMYASLADRSSRKLINRLMKIELLVIDELGYLNLKPEQTNVFFKLMDARHRRCATVVTTNLAYEEWYDFLGKKQMVAALLDRLRQNCTTLHIDGPSLRTPAG